jgi:hypothetical protein
MFKLDANTTDMKTVKSTSLVAALPLIIGQAPTSKTTSNTIQMPGF